MITALRLVLAGEVYVPPVMLAALEGLEAASVQVTAASVEEGGVDTVKLHVTAVMRALNTCNRTQAVIAATRRGLIPTSNQGS